MLVYSILQRLKAPKACENCVIATHPTCTIRFMNTFHMIQIHNCVYAREGRFGSVGIYSTGNPVHLPSPNPYSTCGLTNPNFRCCVFFRKRISADFISVPILSGANIWRSKHGHIKCCCRWIPCSSKCATLGHVVPKRKG